MMNTSSKFGISTKQSLIAFVIMIALIIVASGFAEQNNIAQAGVPNGYDYALAASSSGAPTATPFQPIVPKSVDVKPSALPQILDLVPTATPVVLTTQPAPSVTSESQQIESEKALPPVLEKLLSLATGKSSPHSPTGYTVFMPSISQGLPPTPVPPTPTENPMLVFTPQEYQITNDEGRSSNDYASPSLWPDIQIPSPAGILAHPDDQVNILLLGSDQREGDSGFRTDTIQLLTINPSEGSVKLTSFPRDLYVYIPGYTMQRINTAFGWGGFEALADTMEYNFGVRPDHYVLINFRSFKDVIDSLDGITVDIGKDMCDHRDDWEGNFCVSEGSSMWMSGETALWYVRSRYTTSDLDRGRRQQEVLLGAFKKIVSLHGLTKVPQLYEIYKDSVTTDVSIEMVIRLLPVAALQSKSPNIDRFSIGAGQVYNWTNYSGAMVLVPLREPVMEVMREAICEP